jgi:hypothetical protein
MGHHFLFFFKKIKGDMLSVKVNDVLFASLDSGHHNGGKKSGQ